ncbi:hypothetical protein TcWFU_005454 [Taenia crassiceps]|uniref:Uncharacterized protein n=1 Tax=Taenia crassiceps TaxID=6207 RepID=A0ABR4Q6Z8_9CEST
MCASHARVNSALRLVNCTKTTVPKATLENEIESFAGKNLPAPVVNVTLRPLATYLYIACCYGDLPEVCVSPHKGVGADVGLPIRLMHDGFWVGVCCHRRRNSRVDLACWLEVNESFASAPREHQENHVTGDGTLCETQQRTTSSQPPRPRRRTS